MWLLLFGIIATPVIGISREWANWPFFTVLLVAILFMCAGVRLQYRLLRAKFYIRIWGLNYRMLSALEEEPFKGAIGFELTISNQENKPRGVSRLVLEIQMQNGYKKEFTPMKLDGKTKEDITLYLKPNEPQTISLNFVYEGQIVTNSEKLYVFDDRGTWCRIPINIDTMVTMSKKSKSRSGDYQIK